MCDETAMGTAVRREPGERDEVFVEEIPTVSIGGRKSITGNKQVGVHRACAEQWLVT